MLQSLSFDSSKQPWLQRPGTGSMSSFPRASTGLCHQSATAAIWDEEVGSVDFLPPPPGCNLPRKPARSLRGSDPNVTGREVQVPFSPPTRRGPEGSSRAAARGGHERSQCPTTARSEAARRPRPLAPAPPTAARLDQSGRRATRPTEVGLTSLRVSRPVSGARLTVGVVCRGPRLRELFTRGGSRGEGILRAPRRPRCQNFPP